MSTLGYTTTPTGASWGDGWNVGNQVGLLATTPAGGGILISTIHCYAATFAGTCPIVLVVWSSSGAVLASVSGGSIGTSSTWVSGNLSSSLYVAGSTNIYIGWANLDNSSSNSGFTAEYDSAGGTVDWNLQASSPPGNLLTSATQYTNRNIGAYVDYVNAGAYVNTGTSGSPVWTAGPAYVNTGTPASPTWSPAVVYINTGTPASPVWTPGA